MDFITMPFGGPISLTVCKPTLNDEIKNFQIKIFNSLQQALSNNLHDKFVQEAKIATRAATRTATPITTSTPRNYRNFRARFQWGHLRR